MSKEGANQRGKSKEEEGFRKSRRSKGGEGRAARMMPARAARAGRWAGRGGKRRGGDEGGGFVRFGVVPMCGYNAMRRHRRVSGTSGQVGGARR